MNNFVSRSQWGAKSASDGSGWRYAKRGITWHHGGGDTPPVAHRDCAARVRSYQSQHMNGEWYDIAYNFLVCKHGYVFEGRGWGDQSGANGTTYANRRYLAVCFIGNGDKALTNDAKRAALALRAEATKRGFGDKNRPHSHWKSTGCPGKDVRAWVKGGLSAPNTTKEMEDEMFVEEGDRGDAVEFIQRLCNQLGSELEQDGVYGKLTTEAVAKHTGTKGDKITPYRYMVLLRECARVWDQEDSAGGMSQDEADERYERKGHTHTVTGKAA